MKKTGRTIPLIIAGIVFLLTSVGCAMMPVETGKIPNTDIFAVKNNRNSVFFINTNSGYMMIDAGADAKTFEKSIAEAGIRLDEIKWILLTHSDFDHVAGLDLFPNAVIHMSRDELPLVSGTMKRSVTGGNKMPPGVDTGKIILLSDGQELSFGGVNVKCLSAPGHTPGSMVFLADARYLFTGDAFKVSRGKIGVHPFTMDSGQAKRTIEQIRDTINKSAVVLTAHYGLLQ